MNATSVRKLNRSATAGSHQPRDAAKRTNSTTAAKIPSTVAAERAVPSTTTLGSALRRRCRPGRCLRDGVRSSHRANAASSSTPGAAGLTPAPSAHVRYSASRPA